MDKPSPEETWTPGAAGPPQVDAVPFARNLSMRHTPVMLWVLGVILVLYVTLCTGQRDNHPTADAWEHHRVLLALSRHLWHPGNPTYALDIPSIRYSPYMVAQALVVRATGVDPYRILGAAAVLNTLLLVLAVWAVLKSFHEEASAAAALLVMVGLYFVAPAYANSYALSDLPWQQVNPSAWSFALSLFGWALLRWATGRPRTLWVWPVLVLLYGVAVLDHAMTGAFGLMGLMVIAATRAGERRWAWVAGVIGVGVAAMMLACFWPWFSFLSAVRWHEDREYWFNRTILVLALTQYCAAAFLCGVAATTVPRSDLARTFLIGGFLATFIGVASFVLKSPVLARFPIPGMIFFHLPTGVFLHRTGALSPSAWATNFKRLLSGGSTAAVPALQMVVLLCLGYGLATQFWSILNDPWLGRAYVAHLMKKENRQVNLKSHMDALLGDVGERDVVLADEITSWPVPSSHGKIVIADHYELFVHNQAQRAADVRKFFSDATPMQRLNLLRKYDVRWILLNQQQVDKADFAQLADKRATVRKDGELQLMDARIWATDHSGIPNP